MATDAEVVDYLGSRGPLIEIFLSCRRGAIGASVADAAVADRNVVESMTATELVRVSDRCVRWGYQGHWQDALLLHGLLMTCCLADTARFAPAMAVVVPEHLRVVTLALWNVANHAIYARARAIGEKAWSAARDPGVRNKIAHEMGVLHLDPYVATRKLSEFKHWWAPVAEKESAPEGAVRMPEPLDALDLSRHWLSQSLEGSKGIHRLQSLKALIQGAMSRSLFGAERDEKFARELLPEALALAAQFPHRTDIASYLEAVADALDIDAPEGLTSFDDGSDWEARIESQGIDVVADNIVAILRARRDNERARALAFVRKVEPIFESRANEALRIAFHRESIRLMLGPPRQLPSSLADIQSALANIERAGADASTRGIEQALGWVSALIAGEQEAEAGKLIVALCKAAPDFYESVASTVGLLKAQLDLGAGDNCIRAGKADEAVVWYYSAWGFFHREHYYQFGLNLLSRIADVLPEASAQTANIVCELVREQPTPWVEGIDVAWQDAIAALVAAATVPLEQSPTASGWFALCRLAKGPAYADQVTSNVVYDWRSDRETVALLLSIRKLENSLELDRPSDADDLFEYLLAATRSVPKSEGGATAAEQRDNLARRLDLHVRSRLVAGASQVGERFDIYVVQARLPTDVVLVDLLFPPDAKSFGYCVFMTRESIKLCRIRYEELAFKSVRIGSKTSDNLVSPAAMTVLAVRQEVQADPPHGRALTATADARLAHAAREFLGDGIEWLAEAHAAGKRHLVVVPDRAMHFLPFHLLGSDRPLADDWIVTYLPSMDLLRRPSEHPHANGAAVFGLRYEGTDDELQGAGVEAQAVAKALGVAMSSEAEATPARVLDALSSKRYVHIACHGEHDVVAATLQSLRLTPGEDDDGRLRSLDLVGRDLRGLSVLALSACETGLGRVDFGGNPLGLATCALASGADSVVTTLWPSADDASVIFFTTMFRGLGTGQSRRDAFRTAQIATRAQFPEYRDWGAFCLSGRW